MVNVIETFDAKETFALGEKIGKEVQPGDIFCLEGDLGVEDSIYTGVCKRDWHNRTC